VSWKRCLDEVIACFDTSNSKENNVLNEITIKMKNTKSTVGQYGLPAKMKVGSGAMEE
jgi:hypothetical protein